MVVLVGARPSLHAEWMDGCGSVGGAASGLGVAAQFRVSFSLLVRAVGCELDGAGAGVRAWQDEEEDERSSFQRPNQGPRRGLLVVLFSFSSSLEPGRTS